jgi:hypothetical protein
MEPIREKGDVGYDARHGNHYMIFILGVSLVSKPNIVEYCGITEVRNNPDNLLKRLTGIEGSCIALQLRCTENSKKIFPKM